MVIQNSKLKIQNEEGREGFGRHVGLLGFSVLN
jgi:hypothetical protein